MEFIDLKTQYKHIKNDVLNEISAVLDSGQFILGDKVKDLELKLSDYTGSKHCIGVADGTKALLIALMAIDIKPGDEVIVPAFSFIATASMIVLLGATPVFVDVDPLSYNLDATKLDAAITKNTKAIIPVSLFGQCADMDAINSIAAKYNIVVIEDAAQSFGATYKSKRSCNLSTISCTSFFPSKPLGCYGDGGACFTNNDEIAATMRQIRIHGQDKRYHHARLGLNGRLDTLQAAVLLVKMSVFEKEVQKRQEIGARYTELLQNVNCVTPKVIPGNTHVYGQYTLLVDNREDFIAKLKLDDIPTAIHYPIPLHKQPVLSKFYQNQDLSVAERLSNHVVSIPMHPYLDEATQDKIVNAIKKSL